jgi:hypothetical protein
MLVRAHANISLCYIRGHGVLFTTTERAEVGDSPAVAPHSRRRERRHAADLLGE